MLRILTILTVLLISLIFASPIFAQTNQLDLTTSPLFFEFSTEKGATITDKIRVRNNSANPITLTIGLQRLAPGANNEATLSDPKGGDEFVSWLSIENQTITARPREWTDIPFTINVPDTAAFGYYFAFLLSQAPPEKEEGTAKVVGGVAIPVLLNVKAPGAKIDGSIVSFKSTSGFYQYPPITLLTTFNNTGNIHIKPRGNIFIKNALTGRQVAIVEVNPEQGSVLPGANRTFESDWSDSFIVREPVIEDGKVVNDTNGKPKTKLTVHWGKILDLKIGKYTATTLLVVSGEDRDYSYEASTSFVVFPYLLVLGITAFTIFAIIGMANTIKSAITKIARFFKRKQ